MDKKINDLARTLSYVFDELFSITNAYSAFSNFDPVNGIKHISFHLSQGEFINLTKNMITCLENRQSKDYPYQMSVIINGIKFYCLLKEIREIA